jgi:hypothetical protein
VDVSSSSTNSSSFVNDAGIDTQQLSVSIDVWKYVLNKVSSVIGNNSRSEYNRKYNLFPSLLHTHLTFDFRSNYIFSNEYIVAVVVSNIIVMSTSVRVAGSFNRSSDSFSLSRTSRRLIYRSTGCRPTVYFSLFNRFVVRTSDRVYSSSSVYFRSIFVICL